jgi:serine/threonine-protein kinase HipA
VTIASVMLWGRRIGAVLLEDGERAAVFQYDPAFVRSNIQLAPIAMPLSDRPYTFPALPRDAFHGLPGMLADSLPDRYGTALVNAWLAAQGRNENSFDVVERLCYVGTRGMGALEFHPAREPARPEAADLQVDALVRLASEVLTAREEFIADLAAGEDTEAMRAILSVGTSAGGARAKAVIAFNADTGQVRSGQVDAGPGFEHWLLKFDGVSNNRDKGLADPQGWGAVEYAYHLMARAAGIHMTECRLLEEGGRRHFMTRRFDRPAGGGKLHMQSLAAIAHFDYNQPGAYGYEQAFLVIRELGLGMSEIEQQFRRMAFNVVARNQDDHVKNIAFLMDPGGAWKLSPAFDITFAWEAGNRWLDSHQMTLNGKRDGFTVQDLREVGAVAGMKRGRPETILAEAREAVGQWRGFAAEAGVDDATAERIGATHRLELRAR